jgi:hypothetical protein
LCLRDEERTAVLDALRADNGNQTTHFSPAFILDALQDWKAWCLGLVFLGLDQPFSLPFNLLIVSLQRILTPSYAIILFTPSIIAALGFTAAQAQLLSVPPFAAAVVANLVVGAASDRAGVRGPFVVAGAIVALIGYTLLYVATRPGVAYAGAIVAATGVYATTSPVLAWASNNAGGETKRSVVLGMVVGLANLGGCALSVALLKPHVRNHRAQYLCVVCVQ